MNDTRFWYDEVKLLRCQNGTANNMSRILPYVFTKQGIVLVLRLEYSLIIRKLINKVKGENNEWNNSWW